VGIEAIDGWPGVGGAWNKSRGVLGAIGRGWANVVGADGSPGSDGAVGSTTSSASSGGAEGRSSDGPESTRSLGADGNVGGGFGCV